MDPVATSLSPVAAVTCDSSLSPTPSRALTFWQIIGIEDEFDRSYLTAQVERFCQQYSIQGTGHIDLVHEEEVEEEGGSLVSTPTTPDLSCTLSNQGSFPFAAWSVDEISEYRSALSVTASAVLWKEVNDVVTEVPSSMSISVADDRGKFARIEQHNVSEERKLEQARGREETAAKKGADHAATEAERMERRNEKLVVRNAAY